MTTTERFKKFTILHSNDMHGDFLAEAGGEEGHLIGGVSLLSGYINSENRIPGESCCFQVSKGIQAVYSDSQNQLESLNINGKPVQADAHYTICVEEYHYKNSVHSLIHANE